MPSHNQTKTLLGIETNHQRFSEGGYLKGRNQTKTLLGIETLIF